MTRLLVDALAVYRLSRLVTRDVLTRGLREKVIERAYLSQGARWGACEDGLEVHRPGKLLVIASRWDEVPGADDAPPKLASLISCSWCSSVYLAFGAVVARRLFPRLWAPVAEALAFSAVAGLVSGLERD